MKDRQKKNPELVWTTTKLKNLFHPCGFTFIWLWSRLKSLPNSSKLVGVLFSRRRRRRKLFSFKLFFSFFKWNLCTKRFNVMWMKSVDFDGNALSIYIEDGQWWWRHRRCWGWEMGFRGRGNISISYGIAFTLCWLLVVDALRAWPSFLALFPKQISTLLPLFTHLRSDCNKQSVFFSSCLHFT